MIRTQTELCVHFVGQFGGDGRLQSDPHKYRFQFEAIFLIRVCVMRTTVRSSIYAITFIPFGVQTVGQIFKVQITCTRPSGMHVEQDENKIESHGRSERVKVSEGKRAGTNSEEGETERNEIEKNEFAFDDYYCCGCCCYPIYD